MLTIAATQPFGACTCPPSSSSALSGGFEMLNSDEDLDFSDATNTEDTPRNIIVPIVAIAGAAAVIAGVAAALAVGRRRHALGTRYRVTVRYRKFPTPTSLCVEAPSKDEAAALVSGGAKGVKIVRVARGC